MDYFIDEELGKIEIKRDSRARRFIFRASSHGMVMTVPIYSDVKSIMDAFNRTKHKLTVLKEKSKKNKIAFFNGMDVEIADFRIVLKESQYGNMFNAYYKDDILEIVSPKNTDYDRPEVNKYILGIIEKVLKKRAVAYLPNRLKFLAGKIGARYNSCEISYGKQRLGRCDNKGNILLSYRLMLLPGHLSDYIIFHELAHLEEMNHGDRFHKLLNIYCGGFDKLYNRELKAFIYPF